MGALADKVIDAEVIDRRYSTFNSRSESYTLGIPEAILSASRGEGTLTFSTDTGSFTILFNIKDIGRQISLPVKVFIYGRIYFSYVKNLTTSDVPMVPI
jgi:hypothetical protein